MSDIRLKGKTALITGGSAGIRFGTAKRFLEECAMVYIIGRRVEKLKEAVDRLGDELHYIAADVGYKADMDRTAKVIEEEQGKLDIVFYNLGIRHTLNLRILRNRILTAYSIPISKGRYLQSKGFFRFLAMEYPS